MENINIKTIMDHIQADVPLLIKGRSGWGKSAIVKLVAEKLELPLVIANSTSWAAEDFGGLPRELKKENCYTYLPPKWVKDYMNQKFILFIDEINQANVSVLHALYRVVLDREVAGCKLNFYVIAAGNYDFENPYLTELMEPLVKRFSLYEWKETHNFFCSYLNKKYNVNLTEIYTNPRATEMALKLYAQGNTDAARNLGGEQLLKLLQQQYKSVGEQLINEIKIDEVKLRNGVLR